MLSEKKKIKKSKKNEFISLTCHKKERKEKPSHYKNESEKGYKNL